MEQETVEDVQGTPNGDALDAQEVVVDEVPVVDEVKAPEPVQPEPTPAAETEDTEATENPTGSEQDGETDEEQKRAALDRKLARENQALRKRLRESEGKVKEFEEAQLSEQERQQKRLAELEQMYNSAEARLRESALSMAITNEAMRLNIIDPPAAIQLIDRSGLEYDSETNSYTGVEEAVASLVTEKSYLVKQDAPQKDAAPANPARRRTRLTRESLAEMTDAEIAALPWDDVHAALQS
jgi:hypothetical protein